MVFMLPKLLFKIINAFLPSDLNRFRINSCRFFFIAALRNLISPMRWQVLQACTKNVGNHIAVETLVLWRIAVDGSPYLLMMQAVCFCNDPTCNLKDGRKLISSSILLVKQFSTTIVTGYLSRFCWCIRFLSMVSKMSNLFSAQ